MRAFRNDFSASSFSLGHGSLSKINLDGLDVEFVRGDVCDSASLRDQLALWCREDVRYVVFDRGDGRPEQEGMDNNAQPLSSFAWTRAPGIAAHRLFSARGVDVLSVRPCNAVTRGE